MSDWLDIADDEIRSFLKDCGEAKVPHLVWALPFISGSRDPERFARANLSILSAAKSGSIASGCWDHQPGESLRERLRVIDHCWEPTHPQYMHKGMCLLELVCLRDHDHDRKRDAEIGKYNPVNGDPPDMDMDAEKERLEREIASINCPEIDAILTAQQAWDLPRACPDGFCIWFC